ncbi:MAG: hypothetical protein IPM76_24610 [Chloroflexi bacterium]|nr:hypothetical protein [Chloroflexota bacterium]
MGAAGVISVVPAAAEISASIFGLTQIVWFAGWVWRCCELRKRPFRSHHPRI